ncbi:MAG: hypothetical protein WBM69_04915 [Desulfobacterales bacterium]
MILVVGEILFDVFEKEKQLGGAPFCDFVFSIGQILFKGFTSFIFLMYGIGRSWFQVVFMVSVKSCE